MTVRGDVALLTPSEMADADARAIAGGVSGLTLMEAAGRAVGDSVAGLVHAGGRVAVICGPGNNGGDGFVAARVLRAAGRDVRVALLGERGSLSGDAAAMAARWTGPMVPPDQTLTGWADVIVDALFGAGLSRPVEAEAARIVERINASGRRVVAVDLPSGISGATGQVLGCAVKAAATVTFFRRKPGHLLLPGRLQCGDTTCVDIGIPASVLTAIAPRVFANAPALWRDEQPQPRLDGHKYSRGHAVVVSGPSPRSGAARLAARGALRVGAGLVTVLAPESAVAENAAHLTAIMLEPFAGAEPVAATLADARRNAVVVGPGCGVGPGTAALVRQALRASAGVVLDADALTSFAGDRAALFQSIAQRAGGRVVLTPHDGELARVFGDLDGSRLERARAAAVRSGAVVVLKGADTVVAAPDGIAAINENAPPWLATAGAGDVLAGMIAGLLAQGMPTWAAACAAVWMHGDAASRFGPGLIAEDIPEMLPGVLRGLGEPGTA